MAKSRLTQIAEHYDVTDTSGEMERSVWGTDTEPEPMVTTSLRLPKSLLDWVREQGDDQHMKPTALIRVWLEERRAGRHDLAERVRRLEGAVFRGDG